LLNLLLQECFVAEIKSQLRRAQRLISTKNFEPAPLLKKERCAARAACREPREMNDLVSAQRGGRETIEPLAEPVDHAS
jgi:hypothetical protein